MNIGGKSSNLTEVNLRGRERSVAPQTLRLEGEPTSDNSIYQVFGKKRFQSVYATGFPYAAFAPGSGQTVRVNKVSTWTLPAIGDLDEAKDNPLDHHSGLAPLVGAGGDIRVDHFEHGEAYSRSGRVNVKGGAIGFKGYFPMETWGRQTYVKLLETSVDSAKRKLSAVATNKTGLIFGNLSLSDTIQLVTKGRTPRNFLTYQAASDWWFFLLPNVKPDGLSLKIGLHVPLPADTQALTGHGRRGQSCSPDPKTKKEE